MLSLTAREFHQATARAMRAASQGPVFITHRGKPALVLLSQAEYKRITRPHQSIVQALAMPGAEDVDLESVLPPRRVEPHVIA